MDQSDIPGPMSGTHPLAAWCNKLRRAVLARTPRPGLGYKLRETTTGFSQEIIPGQGGKSAPALSLQRFRLKSIGVSVLVCRTWDGTTEGNVDTMVAMPFKLRPVGYEYIDGRLITYAYGSNVNRVASATGIVDEPQNIVPRYLVPVQFTGPAPGFPVINYPGDEIFAEQFESPLFTASGAPVYYQDLNVDGRAWAKVYGT